MSELEPPEQHSARVAEKGLFLTWQYKTGQMKYEQIHKLEDLFLRNC